MIQLPEKETEKTLCLPCNHCSFIVCCGAGTQIRSQPGFRRAAALPFCLCCEGTRSSHWLPGSPLKALCRQVFANRSLNSLCLKWHGLSRGSEWGFDLSLARHEKKWLHLKFPTASVTANSCTCSSAPPISRQPLGLWLLKFNDAFTAAFSILAHFFPLRLAASACWENGKKMTPVINSYALDLVIYCSARRRSGGFLGLLGSRPFEGWHQKRVEWPQHCRSTAGNPRWDHISPRAMEFWWKTAWTFFAGG